jgi:hypothetical protein
MIALNIPSQSVHFRGSPSNFVSVSFGIDLWYDIGVVIGSERRFSFVADGRLAIHEAVDFAFSSGSSPKSSLNSLVFLEFIY